MNKKATCVMQMASKNSVLSNQLPFAVVIKYS